MAKQNEPVFTINGVVSETNFGTANTARDGSGTIATAYTAPSDGARISYLRFKATVNTTAGMWRIFERVNSGGTWRLIGEVSIPAITVSATVPAAEGEFYFTEPCLLPASAQLGVSTHNAENANVFVFGSAYN